MQPISFALCIGVQHAAIPIPPERAEIAYLISLLTERTFKWATAVWQNAVSGHSTLDLFITALKHTLNNVLTGCYVIPALNLTAKLFSGWLCSDGDLWWPRQGLSVETLSFSIPVSILDGQPLVPEYLSLGFAMFPELPQRCPHSSSLSRGFTIHHLVLESLLSMSVGFHSEYNDRTERGTQDLECSLSCQTIYNPSLWAQKWRCATVDCTPSLALRMLCSLQGPNSCVCVCGGGITWSFSNLQQTTVFAVSMIASYSCSWLTGVEPQSFMCCACWDVFLLTPRMKCAYESYCTLPVSIPFQSLNKML